MIQTAQPKPLSPARLEWLDESAHRHPHPGPIVYYLRNAAILDGSPVKIGTTANLPVRIEQLQRTLDLALAVIVWEPGGYTLERRRHGQFARSRIGKTEWFWCELPLVEHMIRLGATADALGDPFHYCRRDEFCKGCPS